MTEPDPIVITFTTDSLVSCLGNDGALSVSVTGGTNYLQGDLTWWTNSNWDTINDMLTNNFALFLSNLPADQYQVTVEDDNGCFASSSYVLNNMDPLQIQVTADAVLCAGEDALVAIAVSGGVTYDPYQVTVNGFNPLSAYSAGTYTVQAADTKGCTTTATFSITDPAPLISYDTVSASWSYTWDATDQTYTVSGTYTTILSSINGCDSTVNLILTIDSSHGLVQVPLRVFLSGPYDAETGLMHDDLRASGLLPLTSTYTYNTTRTQAATASRIQPELLKEEGERAIVDWICVELREVSTPSQVLVSQSGLLLRNGDIVNTEDKSPLCFTNIIPGYYYVSIRHRNHLGVMTANPVLLNSSSAPIDFTRAGRAWVHPDINTNPPMINQAGICLLYPGDANGDHLVKQEGVLSDHRVLRDQLPHAAMNDVRKGYYTEDLNMDGQVRYMNYQNDKDVLLRTLGLTDLHEALYEHIPN